MRYLVATLIGLVSFYVAKWMISASLIPFVLYGMFGDREPVYFGFLHASDTVVTALCLVLAAIAGTLAYYALSKVWSDRAYPE